MRDQRAMRPALLVSMLLHLAFWGSTSLVPVAPAERPALPAPAPEPIDVWAGDTAALPGTGQESRPVDRPPSESARAAPAPDTPEVARAAPASDAPQRAPQTSPEPRAEAGGARAKTPAIIAEAGGARAKTPATTAAQNQAAPRSPSPRRPSRGPRADAGAEGRDEQARPDPERSSSGDTAAGSGAFGAAGRSAVRSLGRAFTRAIPPACQADRTWASLPPGSAGKVRIVIDVDGAGHIASWHAVGDQPPARHFENLAKRTIALLGAGTFAVARGAVTAGKQTLEISAFVRTSAEAADTGAPADLAFHFEGDRGKAAFVQPGGRHVEITVQVVRTEIAGGPPPG